MAHTAMLQDWTTISGAASQVVTQPEDNYVEVPSFQDVAIYLELASVSSATATTLLVQASPTKDEVFFGASIGGSNAYLATYSLTSSTGTGVQAIQAVRWSTATSGQLLARWVRWKATFPTGGSSITFRIWLNLNQAGWR